MEALPVGARQAARKLGVLVLDCEDNGRKVLRVRPSNGSKNVILSCPVC